jgi:hypothetical protein
VRVVLALLLSTSCDHVVLEVPERRDKYALRTEAFERLRPRHLTLVEAAYRGHRLHDVISIEGILLGDDTLVRDPIDLVPAVLPTSETARRIEALEGRAAPGRALGWAALSSASVGLTMAIVGFSALQGNSRTSVLVAALLIGAPLTLAFLMAGRLLVGNPDQDRLAIFKGYETDLRDRLGLTDAQDDRSPIELAPPAPDPPETVRPVAPDESLRAPLKPK